MQPLQYANLLTDRATAAPRAPLTVPARTAVTLVVSAAGLLLLTQIYDVRAVAAALAHIPASAVAIAVIAIALGLAVSCLRYAAVLSALGLPIPLALAARANLVGILGGVVFFQALGQTLARTAVLGRRGIGGPAVLLANVYERATALLSLALLGLAGAIHLYGGLSFALVGGGAGLVKLLLALAVATVAAAAAAPRLTRLLRASVARALLLSGAGAVAGYSLGMHVTTLAAFVTLGAALAPEIPLLDLAAASLVVMFVASVPVSFAGWGLRELSAVYAYGKIGMAPDKALAVSILVGVTSLALAILLGAACYLREPAPGNTAATSQTRAASFNIARALTWLLPALAAVLVFFQVHVPVAAGAINVNLADPVAIAGGFVFLARAASLRPASKLWRVDRLDLMLLAMTAYMVFAYLNGRLGYGASDWALWNRLVGWLVLLAYVATGALLRAGAGAAGERTLIDILMASGVAIAVVDLVLHFAAMAGLGGGWLPLAGGISGMAQNPNAFALQVAVLLAFTCAGTRPGSGSDGVRASSAGRLQWLVVAILLLALFHARSRTGYVAGIGILAAALALRWIGFRTAVKAVATAAFLIALPGIVHLAAQLVTAEAASASPGLALRLTHASSDAERWLSIQRGLELWTAHPAFGAGLGAFMTTIQAETGHPLVIHNTSVWLLAELGIVGLALFSGMLAAIWRSAWTEARDGDRLARGMVLALLACGLFQMTHDIFTQRIVWLLVGATMFVGFYPRTACAAAGGTTAPQASSRPATCSAMASDEVSPGLSMP